MRIAQILLIRAGFRSTRIPPLLAVLVLFGGLLPATHAFSLLGPCEPWMLPETGFAKPGDIGGPMNLGQEYRWNVPVLTYAFDPSFLDYFGSQGVAAVESAVTMLNTLPGVNESSPLDFPLQASYLNLQAQAEGLLDLKSQTLTLLLEQFGLATPTRFTFCVRSYAWVNDQPQVTEVQRNYDPYAWQPSAEVNGTSNYYALQFGPGHPPASVDAVEFPVDPSDPEATAVADGALTPGLLYTGLTRDDAAGLRYLLQTNNFNMETLLPDVHGAGTNAGVYVDGALRGGVDKIVLVNPGNYDPLLGQFLAPYASQYTDTYLSNGPQRQWLERVVTKPDILFSAGDLSGGTFTPRFVRTGTTNWLSFATAGNAGPGLIRPPVRITFHRPTLELQTADSLTNGNVVVENFQDYRWGSFDQSAAAPVAYPVGAATPSTNLALRLEMDFAGRAQPVLFTWDLPLPLGNQATVQTSTNLVDWAPVTVLANFGAPWVWRHTATHAQRYFRLVAN